MVKKGAAAPMAAAAAEAAAAARYCGGTYSDKCTL